MPRLGEIRELAREHHGALSLARDLGRLADDAGDEVLAAMNARIARYWKDDMAAHFRHEEAILLRLPGVLPAEKAMTLLDDHRALAAFCVRAAANDLRLASLRTFGERLAAHVRFEERACFDALQDALEATSQ